MLKKVFWVSLGFFLLTLVFLGVYQFAFKHNTSNPIADPEKRAKSLEEEALNEGATARSLAFENFVSEPLLFPAAADHALYYYSLRDRQLERVNYDQKENQVVMKNLPGEMKRLLWSPTFIGALALMEKDGVNLWYYLDFRNQSQIPLKPDMSRLVWNNLGDSIFYQFTDPATSARSINMSNFDGSDWKKLADIGSQDHFLLAIPQSSRVAFWNRPNGLERGTLESISVIGEGRQTTDSGKFGTDYLWSPNGESLLIGGTDTAGSHMPTIGLASSDGSNYRNLRLPTLINKIVWSRDSQTLYFALPGSFPTGTVLPNDYFGKPIYTKDTFWKLNIKTGKRERLVPLNEMSQAFDATNLFLSPDELSLFFVDRETNKLYRISL